MKAVVESYWTFSTKLGHVWELDEELEKIVREFKESGKDREVKELDDKFLELTRGKNGEILLRFYYLTTTSVLLDENYINQKYGDFLRFIANRGVAKSKEIKEVFHIWASKFIRQCKEAGLIESTSKGYRLTEEGKRCISNG